MRVSVGERSIELVQGDITQLQVDAIVTAANSALAGGGGVDGAVHRAAGPTLLEECRKIGGCPTGDAVATPPGNLQIKCVVHAVGPIYGQSDGRDDALTGAGISARADTAVSAEVRDSLRAYVTAPERSGSASTRWPGSRSSSRRSCTTSTPRASRTRGSWRNAIRSRSSTAIEAWPRSGPSPWRGTS